MNKKEIFAHFSSIIDDMLEESLFFSTYFQRPYSAENMYGSIDDPALPENISIKFGATRGCIIDDYSDYVVKFDVEEDIYGSACERESELYQRAKDLQLNKYFAECVYLGTYTKTIRFYDYDAIDRNLNWCDYDPIGFEEKFIAHEDDFGEIQNIVISIPLYAYPKAKPFYPIGKLGSSEDNDYAQKAKKISSPLRDENLVVAINFIREYGEEEYQRISSFMYEEDINDLHQANFADVGGHYTVIDYAGYHECYEE